VSMTAELAIEDHNLVMSYILRMLCAGVVHGDLSEFNVLLDDYGPVIIDLPQAVDAQNFSTDHTRQFEVVNNMTTYYGQYAPELLNTQYAKEIWALYEAGELHPDIELTGHFEESKEAADVDLVMLEIKAAFAEEQERRERLRLAEGF